MVGLVWPWLGLVAKAGSSLWFVGAVPGSKMGVSNGRAGLLHGTLAYLATAPSIAGVCVTLAGL